jgi:hypothetical protein
MEGRICKGKLKTRENCKYPAKQGSVFCGIHGKHEPQPIAPVLALKNNAKAIKKILRKHKQGLPRVKTPGYIYIFYIKKEKGKNFWKIGKTERTSAVRLGEWKALHGTIVEEKLYKSDYCCFFERVIHLYLDYCRMHRYPIHTEDGVKYYSIYSATGKVIEDVDEEE